MTHDTTGGPTPPAVPWTPQSPDSGLAPPLLNAHLHKLGMTDDPHCPWCPTYLDTPEHLLLQCPRHHSHRTALLQSLLLRRPTLADLLGGSPDPGLAFKILKHTRTFLQKSGQLHRI
ncbi:hypothetical protein GWK47_005780 [Chionoecetes opilio]|uniref:Reverse transcriptase zinc-binding domain-containing protein n=1 Tax=Chionoecetes opilio TaxID=41210 RepID=A0A8J4YHI1_CHIOP|nr:hypothetical protein GWK47_005780 [Chionoecetes opilio]